MKCTRNRLVAMSIVWASMILLTWSATIQAQTNVHVTTEQPFQLTMRSKNWQNTTLSSSFIGIGSLSIPDGKMLVVEQFSAQIAVNPGERAILRVGCGGVQGVKPAEHHPVLTPQGIFGGAREGLEFLSVSLPLRCYATGGPAGLSFSVRRTSQAAVPNTALAESEFTISGFLQDLPAAP